MVPIEARIPNRKARETLQQIRRHGIVSKLELQDATNMKGSTLTRVLEELQHQNLIIEVGFGESTGGRRPILYRMNPDYGYVFGLEISRIHTRFILFDMLLAKLEQRTWMMAGNLTPDVLAAQLAEEAERMLQRRGISPSDVLGVGIGAVGPLDRLKGTIVDPLYFPAQGWRGVNICALLEERLGIPAILDNGANAAIVGEYWADRGRDCQHLLYVHGGVGLRSAMMTSGKVVYGAVDMEGAVGQMIIQSDGIAPRLPGGNHGALESYASVYAIEQQAQSLLKLGRKSILHDLAIRPEAVTFTQVIEAARQNDPLAVEILTQSATYFGIGLANLLNILHPEMVILGGPLVTNCEPYYQVATEVALRKTYYYPEYQVTFSKGKLGDEALATGAAVMVINKLIEF